ncbi:MAG: glycosyl hydrolase [Gemmatimonadota bacterium]
MQAQDRSPSDRISANEIVDSSLFSAMEFRLIGPFRGGRSTTVTGIPGRPLTFFQGTTGGGVWKTTDAGESWENISDGFFEVASVGAVEVAGSDPNVVYAGTGSAGIRGNVMTGKGVYKSTDGGDSWSFTGLPDAGLIGRIRVHPGDPDLVYVAALGHPFGKNEERGVFRSKDGGANWEKVLFVNDSVGAVDLAMNPANPRVLYAGMWRAERKPWTLIDASEDGGLYKTTDGGDSWEKLAGGLPQGLTGRIGVTVSPANPDRVWAQVNAHDPEGGIYRSDDAGESWTRVNRERKLRQRHWYYSHIVADPGDENTVYAMNTSLYRSIDAGKTWETIRVPHGDVHDLWVNPENPDFMVVANDGGAQVSLNAGESWSTLLNQPTAELYRVVTDDRFPYRVYAAQQDNTTISLPSRSYGGLTPYEEWFDVGGCESGNIAVDPQDPDIYYAGCYNGMLSRLNRRTGESRNVDPAPVLVDGVAPMDLADRFQWNFPIVFSPHAPTTLYAASQRVLKSTDQGMSWEAISPDLTTDDESKQPLPGGPLQHDHTSVEVYTTIFSLVESPHTPGVLWAGSDDGRVHLTRNGGGEWQEITPAGLPVDGTVNVIEVSPHQAGRAFLAVHRYRMDDYQPMIYRTNDYGDSWEMLTDGSNGIPADHPVRVVREDPDRRGLLYAGTQFGLFVSFDDGEHWQSFQQNLPVAQVADMEVKEQDLVVATHGRSIWIMDDLTPLHQLAAGGTQGAAGESSRISNATSRTGEISDATAILYRPGLTYRLQRAGRGGDRAMENPPNGAVIRYYLAEEPEEDVEVTLTFLDGSGNEVRSFSREPAMEDDPELPAEAGMNEFAWDLTYPPLEVPEGKMNYMGYIGGPVVVPGNYQVRLTVGDWSTTEPLTVRQDPRLPHVSEAQLVELRDLGFRIQERISEAYQALETIASVREQAQALAERAGEGGFGEELETMADSMVENLEVIEEKLYQTKAESGQDMINFPPQLSNQITYLYGRLAQAYGPPTAQERARLAELEEELAMLRGALQAVLDSDLAAFNAKVRELGIGPVVIPRG